MIASAERTDVHYAFLSGVVRVVVATVAFGMGYACLPTYSDHNQMSVGINVW